MSSYGSHTQFQQPNYQQPHDPFNPNPQYFATDPRYANPPPPPAQPQPPGQLIPHPQYPPTYTTQQPQPQNNLQIQPRYERQGSHASHHSHHSRHSNASRESAHSRHRHKHRYDDDEYEREKRPSFGDTLVLMWDSMWAAVTGGNSRR